MLTAPDPLAASEFPTGERVVSPCSNPWVLTHMWLPWGSMSAWLVLWPYWESRWFALFSALFLQQAQTTCTITTIPVTSKSSPVQRQVSEPEVPEPTFYLS